MESVHNAIKKLPTADRNLVNVKREHRNAFRENMQCNKFHRSPEILHRGEYEGHSKNVVNFSA